MRAIIFGINGQDGIYLEVLLKKLSIEVIGISRSKGNWINGDISDYDFVKNTIKNYRPDYVFHLAANSSVQHDFIWENYETISTGTINILEAVYEYSPLTKVFLTGSGLQFINEGLPISENHSFSPSSAYSVARIQSVYAGRYYRSLGIRVYVGYLFNHDSPFRNEKHVNQKIVQAVKRIAAGSREQLELWDISIQKEFAYAGDIVEAIFRLVSNEIVFEAVIGTGKAYRIEEWLDICFGYFGMDWRENVKKGSPRKKEYNILVSDPTTIFALGWKPKLGIFDLAKLMIEN